MTEAMIRCDACGKQVRFDEETDGPAIHLCTEHEDDGGVPELDFEDGNFQEFPGV